MTDKMKIDLRLKCPYCATRARTVKALPVIPRQIWDCRCGAHVEVKPIGEVLNGKGFAWWTEWSPA